MFHNYCNKFTLQYISCNKGQLKEKLRRGKKITSEMNNNVKEKEDSSIENFRIKMDTEKPLFWSEKTTCRWVIYTHHLCQCPPHHQLSYQFECRTLPCGRGACTCWGSAPGSLCSEVHGTSPSVYTEPLGVPTSGGTTLGLSRGPERVRYGSGLLLGL